VTRSACIEESASTKANWRIAPLKTGLLEVDETFLQYDGIPTYIKKLTELRKFGSRCFDNV
jgi:hypothetical protein